jgi:hypothetical protein
LGKKLNDPLYENVARSQALIYAINDDPNGLLSTNHTHCIPEVVFQWLMLRHELGQDIEHIRFGSILQHLPQTAPDQALRSLSTINRARKGKEQTSSRLSAVARDYGRGKRRLATSMSPVND